MSINQHILDAKQLCKNDKPHLALQELEKIEDLSRLTSRDLIDFHIIKSESLCKLNQYPLALKLAEKGLKLAKQHNNTSYIINALVAKGIAEFRLGKHKECYNSIQEIDHLIEEDSKSSVKDKDLMKERLYNLSTLYYYQSLDLDNFLETNQKRLEICKKYNMIRDLGNVYHNLGVCHTLRGEFLKAIRYYKKSIEISKQTENYTQLAYCLGNTGRIYAYLGDLDLALGYYQQSLDILKEKNNEYLLGAFSNALGTIYIQKGDLEKSMEYFQQGYKLVKKLGNNLNIAGALFTMIDNYLLKKDLESAEKYFHELEIIANQDDNRRIQFTYKFAKALVLKAKGGTRNTVRSGDLFRELLMIKDLKGEPYLRLRYCELLFEEIKASDEEEILVEIKQVLEQLNQIATNSRSFDIKGEIKLLQAKFDLINFSFDQAQKNFIAGQKIARKFDLRRLEWKISQEYDKFLKEYDNWNEMKRRNSALSERLEFSSIDDALKLSLKKKEIELSETLSEISKLLIITSNGENSKVNIYSADKNLKEIRLDFNSLRSKFETDSVDRIMHENNTIIKNQLGNDTIYYVLEGDTYQAKENLENFTYSIIISQRLLESKNLPFNVRQVVEIVKDSDNLIKGKGNNIEVLEKNDLITAPYRFNILYCLYENGPMNWTDLKNKLDMTSGNLDYHLSMLQKKGWIVKNEEYHDRMIQIIDISDFGKEEFRKYINKMSQICQQVQESTS